MLYFTIIHDNVKIILNKLIILLKMKALSLISTGIDSPVASYLLKKQGFEIIYLHLKTKNTNDYLIKKIINKLDPNAKLIIKDYKEILQKIKNNTDGRYTCVLCKRGMLKIAENIAFKHSADCIITGENLGQVASQTLSNMAVISSDIKIPILRPLLCFDKDDTIKISRKIGVFNYSIIDNLKCSFVPINPATTSKIEFIRKLEDKVFN
jgi:tRNA uracil 4-sulfurtransferase